MMGDFGVRAKVTVGGSASASLSLTEAVSRCWLWGCIDDGGGHGLSPSIYYSSLARVEAKQQGRERERTQLSYF